MQAPYQGWRYEYTPTDNSDTSVTGWAVLALECGEKLGFLSASAMAPVNKSALAWLEEVTDRATGRVGYDAEGTGSSRIGGFNDSFPVDDTEGMTAVGLYSRFLLGQDPGETPIMIKHADLLLKSLPNWRQDEMSNDYYYYYYYYWFHGTQAMLSMGGKYWSAWNREMKRVLLDSQQTDSGYAGSWDPNGPWGFCGGRVYSSALACLCLAVDRPETCIPFR